MTETVLAAVVCPVHGGHKEGFTGMPLPDVDLRIVGLQAGLEDMPPGVPGEIAIRAPQIREVLRLQSAPLCRVPLHIAQDHGQQAPAAGLGG